MSTQTENQERLGVAHLMILTGGVAVAFFVGRGLGYLRFPADSYYHNVQEPAGLDLLGMLVAAIYGISVTTLLIALRSKDLWSSPGKTLALLFAMMCLLNWGLDLVAAIIMNFRMEQPIPIGTADNRGYILGIWYRNFSVAIGYVVGLPVLFWVLLKTRNQGRNWQAAWLGFLLFAILIAADTHLGLGRYLPPYLASWYFDLAIGIPMFLLLIALLSDVIRRKPIDWWTALTVIPVISVWLLRTTMRLME